jgi:CheY-like chemotaxis protein
MSNAEDQARSLSDTHHFIQAKRAMRKLNILLVDDNPQFLKAARNLIAAMPCVAGIECANSGVEALTQVGQLSPDLVLTDIMMPEMSGFELIRRLRAGDAPPRVLAVTLHDSVEYRAAVLRSGAEGLISKREFGAAAQNLIASMAHTGNA